LLKAINNLNYKNPTFIQSNSIPSILQGKNCIIQSPTGTGKTATYLIPII